MNCFTSQQIFESFPKFASSFLLSHILIICTHLFCVASEIVAATPKEIGKRRGKERGKPGTLDVKKDGI